VSAPEVFRTNRAEKAAVKRKELVADGFVNPLEAARYLGIGKSWFYALLKAGAITHIRHGRRISVSKVALRQYAEQQLKLGRIA